MTIPVYTDKHGGKAFMTPEMRLSHRYGDSRDWPTVPDSIIITFQRSLFERVSTRPDAHTCDLSTEQYSVYGLGEMDEDVGVVGGFGIGAPTMAIVVEELHALGTDSFCIVGGCGTLQSSVSPRELIVADRAIRDEGTSYHYLEPADTVAASPTLVTELERQVDETGSTTHTGPTWTTDAFYRETTAEIEQYTAEGVLTVEMEAAALFAIARVRTFTAGAIFAPFDRLTTTRGSGQ